MMSTIGDNLLKIKSTLPSQVTLVAVSKYHPNEDVMSAYEVGQRVFGENIVQELKQKYDTLPKDIQWHFIGHLQKNKVKYIAPFVSLIHSVDSFALLETINKYAAKYNRVIGVLLQIHVASEETKFGFTIDECSNMLKEGRWRDLSNISIQGIMGMASNTDDSQQVECEFSLLNSFFIEAKETYFNNDSTFQFRSWGMSSDYLIAIQCGSNMVRVGSSIFGERVYSNKQ